MLTELMNDNKTVIKRMRAAHEIADKHDDVATARFWKTSSTRPRSGTGFCSRPAAQLKVAGQ